MTMKLHNAKGEITGTTKVSFTVAQMSAIMLSLAAIFSVLLKGALAFTAVEQKVDALEARLAAGHLNAADVERRSWTLLDMWTWTHEARGANQGTAVKFPDPHKTVQ